jgi:hypothetical protein
MSGARHRPGRGAGRGLLLLAALLASLALASCGYSRRLLPIQCQEGFGFIDQRGQVVIKPAFPQALPFSEGRAAFSDGEKWGYIDTAGRTEVSPTFDWAGSYREGRAPVRMADRFGYVDLAGELAVEGRYELADEFREGRAVVRRDGRYGYIDTGGTEVVEARYIWAGRFSEGLALVLGEDCFGYIDPGGEMLLRLPMPSMPTLPSGMQEKATDEEEEALPDVEEWQALLDYRIFSEGLAPFEEEGRVGFIDREGRRVIEASFDAAEPFHEGMAAVKLGNKWGYIDKGGGTVIEPAFQQGGAFSEGLAPVKQDGIWGYIDRGGKTVIVPAFDSADSFHQGLAMVAIGESWGYIDKRGSYLWVPTGPGNPFQVRSPSRLPLYLMDAALLVCLALLCWGLVSYSLLLADLGKGRGERVLEAFLRRYHTSRRMERIRKGPFVLNEHLERLERNGRAYLCLTAAFLALLWLPNLAFLALTGRGMFNYLVFHRNLFPGDDWLYVALGTLVLSALAAFLVIQRLLLASLLRYLNRPVPDGGDDCAETPSAGRA